VFLLTRFVRKPLGAVAIGVLLTLLSVPMLMAGDPTCDGQTMRPGDVCEHSTKLGSKTRRNFEQEKESNKLGGYLALGLGSALILGGGTAFVLVRRRKAAAGVTASPVAATG